MHLPFYSWQFPIRQHGQFRINFSLFPPNSSNFSFATAPIFTRPVPTALSRWSPRWNVIQRLQPWPARCKDFIECHFRLPASACWGTGQKLITWLPRLRHPLLPAGTEQHFTHHVAASELSLAPHSSLQHCSQHGIPQQSRLLRYGF